MRNLKEDINVFIKFFENQMNFIDSAKFTHNEPLFKKILYASLIDALAKTIYPKRWAGDRFISFVRNFSGWKFCDQISIPHLVKLLTLSPDPEFSKLRDFVFPIFDKWTDGTVIKLEKDLAYKDARRLWPKDRESIKPIENIQLDSLRHDNLLWTYRNSIVHELRHPGYPIETDRIQEPYYYSLEHETKEDGSSDSSWELVYPSPFFKTISATALKKIEIYYTTNRINPYEFFKFGTYWIGELNT